MEPIEDDYMEPDSHEYTLREFAESMLGALALFGATALLCSL